MRRARPVAGMAFAVAGLLGGCMVGPNFQTPPAPAVDRYTPSPLPAATDAGPAEGAQRFSPGAAVAERWWTLFGSPRLDALEAEALKANADLAAAQAALRQAHELYLAQRAALFPVVGLETTAQRAHNAAVIASPLANNAETYSLYTAQLDVSYTPDVFGGLRRQAESAAAQAENQRFLTEAVYLTLTVNVANAAIQVASLRGQLDDTQGLIEADRRALAVTRDRARQGEAASADVAAAEGALEQAQQLAPPLRKQIDQQRDLLAALLGRTPAQAPAPEAPIDHLTPADFTLPADLPVSLPSELVRRRPDVRAAEANMHVASALLGVATAARLPSFSITANAGGTSTAIDTLFSNGDAFWSAAGGAAQTVFDAGALRHRQGAATAALEQARAQYRSAVLDAFQNTADVLQAIVEDARTLAHAQAAQASTARSLRLARDAFAQGESGVLPVLGAEAADRQSLITLAQARAARYVDTVALFQALGGGWREHS